MQFSFSGLKTAVRYAITGPGKVDFSKIELSEQQIADICASFEEAVVDCLVAKAFHALKRTGHERLCVGGGVAANRRFREVLTEKCSASGVDLIIAPMELCTDNAVMGGIAVERLKAGNFESLDMQIHPGLVR